MNQIFRDRYLHCLQLTGLELRSHLSASEVQGYRYAINHLSESSLLQPAKERL